MTQKSSVKTRERLLDAASAVFVEMGYRDATVAEICTRAGANISAVNYYFGSKKALYREAWLHAFAFAKKVHPPDGGVAAGRQLIPSTTLKRLQTMWYNFPWPGWQPFAARPRNGSIQ